MMLRHSRWSGRHIMPSGPGWFTRNHRGDVASCLVWNQTSSIISGSSRTETHSATDDMQGHSDRLHLVGHDRRTELNDLRTSNGQAVYGEEQNHYDQNNRTHSVNQSAQCSDKRTSSGKCLASTTRTTCSTSVTTSCHVEPHRDLATGNTPVTDVPSSEAVSLTMDTALTTGCCDHITSKRDATNDDAMQSTTAIGSRRHGNASSDASALNDVSQRIGKRTVRLNDLKKSRTDFVAASNSTTVYVKVPMNKGDATSATDINVHYSNLATPITPRASKSCVSVGSDLPASRRYHHGARAQQADQSASSTSDKLTAELDAALTEFRHIAMPHLEKEMIEALQKHLRVQKQRHQHQQPRSTPKTTNTTRASTPSSSEQKLLSSTSFLRPSTASAVLDRTSGCATNGSKRRPPLFGREVSRRGVPDFRDPTPTELRRNDDPATGDLSNLMVVRAATPSDRRFHRQHHHHFRNQQSQLHLNQPSNNASIQTVPEQTWESLGPVRDIADRQLNAAAASVQPAASDSTGAKHLAAGERSHTTPPLVTSVRATRDDKVQSSIDEKYRNETYKTIAKTEPEINKMLLTSKSGSNPSFGEENQLRISGLAILTVRLQASFTR